MRSNGNQILGTRTIGVRYSNNVQVVNTCANSPLLFREEKELPESRVDVTATVLSQRSVTSWRRFSRHYQCKFTLAVHLACTKRPTWCGTRLLSLGDCVEG
jgi:hypothetical protein